ncbi:hypothetical protein V8E54_012219 [Elaphomyces granulatus]
MTNRLQRKSMSSNPELLELTNQRNALHDNIIAKYYKFCRSKESPILKNNEYDEANARSARNEKKIGKVCSLSDYYYEDNVGSTIIEANCQGNPVYGIRFYPHYQRPKHYSR